MLLAANLRTFAVDRESPRPLYVKPSNYLAYEFEEMGILAAPAGLHHHRTADVARRQRDRGRLSVSSLAPATFSHCYVFLLSWQPPPARVAAVLFRYTSFVSYENDTQPLPSLQGAILSLSGQNLLFKLGLGLYFFSHTETRRTLRLRIPGGE